MAFYKFYILLSGHEQLVACFESGTWLMMHHAEEITLSAGAVPSHFITAFSILPEKFHT